MNINMQNDSMTSIRNILKFTISVFFILVVFFIPAKLFTQVINGTIEFDGRTRDYTLFLPMNYNNLDSLPLILNFHGYSTGVNGNSQMNYTSMNTIADTAGFIAVYPTAINSDGSSGSWDIGSGDVMNGVGFINALLDTLGNLYKINNDQVYACGFSNGGYMANKLGAVLSHRIAAISSCSGGIVAEVANNIEFKRPMPYLCIHGTEDRIVTYGTGEMTVAFWEDLNICSEPDTIVIPDINTADNCNVEKITYTNESTGCNVILYRVINGGHTWPGASANYSVINRDINAGEEMCNFFKQYKLSELSFLDHDITPRSLLNDLKTLPRFINIKPTVLMQNGGSNDESEIPAAFEIDSSGTIVYEYSQVFEGMKSMEKKDLVFDNSHTLYADHYEFMCASLLADDENVENDTLKSKITVTNCIDDFESGHDSQWISDYGWGVQKGSAFASSGDYALYCRQDNSYKDADTTTATFFSSFNLSSLETAYISFSTKYEFYEGDAGYVEISVDNGQTWVIIGDTYTGNQEEHELSEIPLESYTKPDITELMVRFKVINNPANGFPKWYIDDVTLHPNGESGTAVKSEHSSIGLDHFVLNENYPNPFNQSTIITYSISQQQVVTLKIMNILGQEVITLLNKQQPPGEYSITWNGQNHSGHEVNSGVYYCQIQTSGKILTRKMILLK